MAASERRLDPEVGEIRRLKVINGALGRRRWSAESKARIVAESWRRMRWPVRLQSLEASFAIAYLGERFEPSTQ